MTASSLTQEELKRQLHYDPITGIFTWKIKKLGIDYKTMSAGSMSKGYIVICLNYKKYLAHRLAWLYIHGTFPKEQLDHIDGDRSNNKLINLRECNNAENMKNIGIKSDNTSGFKGVCFDKQTGKWRVRCRANGKVNNLGRYETAEIAGAVYMEFAKQNHGEFYKE